MSGLFFFDVCGMPHASIGALWDNEPEGGASLRTQSHVRSDLGFVKIVSGDVGRSKQKNLQNRCRTEQRACIPKTVCYKRNRQLTLTKRRTV